MEISTKELPEAVIDILYAGLTPYITSSPGNGKSDICKQVFNQLNLEIIDVRPSTLQVINLIGFPHIKDGKSSFTPPKMFPIEGDPLPKGKDGWGILIDELSSAQLDIQAALYRIILDREVGEYKLHPNVAIIAAGNKASDKAVVHRMSTALQSRLIHVNLKSDVKSWIEWAYKYGIDPRITSFLEFREELFDNFDPNHKDNTYSCARTWFFCHKLIKDKPKIDLLTTKIIAGTVGEGSAREFKTYTEMYESLPNMREIVKNPTSVPISDQPDVRYAITGLISANVNKDNIKPLMLFIERLPLEFQIVTWTNAIARNKELFKLPEMSAWLKAHAKDVI